MKKKLKKIFVSMGVIGMMTVGGASVVYAATRTFGNRDSGASTKEEFQILYTGSAWNYENSRYEWTSFTYKRNGEIIANEIAYDGKVTDSVWDDLRTGKKYTTRFFWKRGPRTLRY